MRLRSLAPGQSSACAPLAAMFVSLAFATTVTIDPATAYQIPTFTRMETAAGLDDLYAANGTYGPGVAVVDIDDDGDLDLFVANDHSGHKFYRNDGTGHFTDIAADVGLQFVAELPPVEDRVNPTELDYTSMMPCFVDTDNDGDKDFFLTGWNTYSRFFENVSTVGVDGQLQLQFVDRSVESGLNVVGRSATAAWGDYNRDGRPDVYIADWGGFDRLFRNVGGVGGGVENRWLDSSDRVRLYDDNTMPMPGWCAIWFDHNQDGWPDLYVGNDYGLPNFFYVSQGDGTFVDRAADYFTEFSQNVGAAGYNATMGQALCDYDHDGDYDLFVANSLENNLYLNTGGVFDDQLTKKELMGPGDLLVQLDDHNIGWFCDFPDLDQDGHEDLFLVNGYIRICVYDDPLNPDCGGEGLPDQPNLLWMNRGDGGFDRVTGEAGLWDLGWGKSGVFADFDLDGDLDLFVTNSHGPGAPGSHGFWRNDTPDVDKGDWLIVSLVGDDQNGRNLDAFGAEVEVTVGGSTWRRLRTASTGYLSYSSPEMHFGLGVADRVDEIRVTWANGDVDVVQDIAASRRVTIVQGQGIKVPALIAPMLRGVEDAGQVRLSWEMPEGSGIDRFLLQRVADGGIGGTIAVIEVEPGQTHYEYVDRQVEPGRGYRYRLTAADGDLRVQGDEFALVVGRMARRVELRSPVPNPFNPRTTLSWRVAPGTSTVRLRLFDLRGRLVREFEPSTEPGWNAVVWDGTDRRGRPVASGNYRFVVEADGQIETTSLTLVR
jgi:hypothetical protein